jgi:hypothetical protein
LLPFLKTLKIRVFQIFIESGSKLPHPENFVCKKHAALGETAAFRRRRWSEHSASL